MIELGQRVRRRREELGKSYRDVRREAGVALSHQQRLERGEVASPSPAVLRRLAGPLELPYEELLREAGYL